LALVASPALGRPSLDSQQLSQLASYDVLVFADAYKDGIEKGKAISVMDATPEEVFRVASDYAKWPEYLPRVKDATVISSNAAGALVEMTADLPWPAGRSRVQVRHTHEKLGGEIYRIRFDMVQGTMKQYLGSLYIEPWLYNKSTLTYEVVAEPDVLAPNSAINRAIRRSASGFVHALRQRLHDLHRWGLLHPLPNPPLPRRDPIVAPLGPASVKARLQHRR
jgi:ribosome-associated toxin RatA of RatAB toxin-antitoxin module